MRVILDLEANGLKPTEIWCIVCKELDTCHKHIFRRVTSDPTERQRFIEFYEKCERLVGHNLLSYDLPVMVRLLGVKEPNVATQTIDTFIVSRLVDYPRSKHSVKDYGIEFGLYKGEVTDFSKYSEELVEYCERDVDITEKIYEKYKKYLDNPKHQQSIQDEHSFQLSVNSLKSNGFAFDIPKAQKLLFGVKKELEVLDKDFLEAFPPKLKLIREILPKETKYGTISLTSVPKNLRQDIHTMVIDAPFSYCKWVNFNPGSPKQVVEVLHDAGWSPVEKTDGHVEAERAVNKLQRQRRRSKELDLELQERIMVLNKLRLTGWKISEKNLQTLPSSAPPAARLLAKRILYESRRKTLTELLGLVDQKTSRIHCDFVGIGAWTHRMSHRKPNLANITNAISVSDGSPILLGKELRQCFVAPKGRLLVGVDAEAIQLRGFAHLINDPVLINAIVNGDKKLGTDPHSLNRTYFGSFCKTRNAAKHSLYAMFFGGTASMLSTIMGCTRAEAQEAIDALILKYPGLAHLQQEVFPIDARRGYFIGIDGRKVRIPGETVKDREHLCMSGYLQNFEKVIMAKATLKFEPYLKDYDSFLVDLVHDEWQNECPNNYDTCEAVAKLECQSLVDVGTEFGLNCPLAGSFTSDDGKPTFGRNWYQTH